jgi:hypothetical protein
VAAAYFSNSRRRIASLPRVLASLECAPGLIALAGLNGSQATNPG